MTDHLQQLTDAELFDRYDAVMGGVRQSTSDDERRRILWSELKPIMNEIERRYPPSPDPLT